MKKVFLQKSTNLIKEQFPTYTKKEIDTIRYGLESLYITISKTIIIFSIALFLNKFAELLLIVFFYNLLRLYSFGLHAKDGKTCFIISSSIFLTFSFLSGNIYFNLFFKSVISLFGLISFIIYSPSDTKKRPIYNKYTRLKYKIISTFIMMSLIIITFTTNKNIITNSIIISIIFQSFTILPISYIIFKQPYRNYTKGRRS